MSKIQAEDIRNLAIIGHSGEGKTSVCEAILFNGRSTDRLGKVPDGNTVTDYDEQEIARKMSISLSVAYTEWEGAKINLLDVPGFYDFEGEMNEALRAAGGALIVMGANGTVTVGAEKAIAICQRAQLPMVIFINGMDKDNADYAGTVAALKQNYAGKIAPIQIPIMQGQKMIGYINAIKEKAYRFSDAGLQEIPIPEDMLPTLKEMQDSLTETAAENDDALLDKYFSEGALTRDEIVHGIRKGIYNVNTIPVMAGSALQNKGIINLMDEIVKYMPKAKERREMVATDLMKDELTGVSCEEDGPFAAPGIQDGGRSFRRQTQYHESIPRHAPLGLDGVQRDDGQKRTHQSDLSFKREKTGARFRTGRGRYRRGEQTNLDQHGRHALRRERESEVRRHSLPPPRLFHGGVRGQKGRRG